MLSILADHSACVVSFVVVEIAKKLSYQRFVPPTVVRERSHHKSEPTTPCSSGAEHPNDVLRTYADIFSGICVGQYCPQRGNLPFLLSQFSESLNRTHSPV